MINGTIFKQMIASGAANLSNHEEAINALNVFPVPDGDTGTNMSMTFNSGVDNVNSSGADDLSSVANALSKGLLMGARGNSGVILSQIFRGFYKSIQNLSEIDGLGLAKAYDNGTYVAYKAVMKPVEGTILTVIREASYYTLAYANANPDASVLDVQHYMVEQAKESLDNTDELLPILKQAGVKDSGGTGLLMVLEGFEAALKGEPITRNETKTEVKKDILAFENDDNEDGYGYCTEFILRLNPQNIETFNEDKFRSRLGQLGNSIVVVHDEEIVKVHVHTLTPGDALNLGQRYGEFIKLKIENMSEQHENIVNAANSEPKEYGLIAVAAGDGLVQQFKDYRCDVVVSGGQTMNPSTQDFIEAINTLNAKHIFILPNNSNIILAAQQAQSVLEDKDITVFETKTIPQGLSACLMFNPEADVTTNISEMKDAISHVRSGQVTYAVKDTTIDDKTIKQGDFMGLFDKTIAVIADSAYHAAKQLIDQMIDPDESELVTLILGEGSSEDDGDRLAGYIESTYDLEVDIVNGMQPVYSYIISVE